MKLNKILIPLFSFFLLLIVTTSCLDEDVLDKSAIMKENTDENIEDDKRNINIEEDQTDSIELKEEKTEFDEQVPNEPLREFAFNIEENQFETYIEENDEFTGMLQVSDKLLDLPVVKGKDNEFYLDHDLNKKRNYYGTLFMDYRNFGAGFDKNIIIYGHNMKDDEMFGPLRNYIDQSFANQHKTITFQDLYTTRTYHIFSSYFAESDGNLITTSFTDETFSDYINEIQNKSLIDMTLKVDGEDNLITLVTCSYELDNGRYFVHAVEIQSEELAYD